MTGLLHKLSLVSSQACLLPICPSLGDVLQEIQDKLECMDSWALAFMAARENGPQKGWHNEGEGS